MLRLGTTLVECKSGYGLETETEMKMLKVCRTTHALCKMHVNDAGLVHIHQVLHQAKTRTPIEIVANYLGAHSVPKGMTADEATEDILKNQIPALKVEPCFVRCA
jgi:imidazolonepropionase